MLWQSLVICLVQFCRIKLSDEKKMPIFYFKHNISLSIYHKSYENNIILNYFLHHENSVKNNMKLLCVKYFSFTKVTAILLNGIKTIFKCIQL